MVVGDQGSSVGLAGEGVVPDSGGHGQEPLPDAGEQARAAAGSVGFEGTAGP